MASLPFTMSCTLAHEEEGKDDKDHHKANDQGLAVDGDQEVAIDDEVADLLPLCWQDLRRQ